MDVPLISVVIPTRHRNVLLAKCLQPLAPGVQTLPADQYEVIVTDDGRESTAEAMIAEKFPWAKWTAGPRRGPAANRNHGASLARGEWIAFTDDDCVPDLQWLAAYRAMNHDGVNVYEGKTTCKAGVKSSMEHAPVNLTGGWLWSCNIMVRRSLFEKLPFDESFPHAHMEDVYYRERLKQMGQSFVFVPKAVVDHPPRRNPPGSKWAPTHESEVVYFYKMKQSPPPLPAYAWRIVKGRIKQVLRHPPSVDSFLAMYHVGVEVLYLVTHYGTWKRRHQHLAKDKPSAVSPAPSEDRLADHGRTEADKPSR